MLVEGESDCHVLWHYGLPALGVPGAGTWKDEWASAFDGIDVIYVVIEPDRGGEALLQKLAESPLRDHIRVIRLDGHKDVLDLHSADPGGFVAAFEAAKASAVRLADLAGLAGADEETGSVAGRLERVGPIAAEATEDQVIDWVRGVFDGAADAVEIAGLRQATINRLKPVASISAPAQLIDAIIAQRETTSSGADMVQGTGVLLSDPEPWEEAVDGGDLLSELRRTLTCLVVLPEHADVATSLWILFTHAHDAWEVSPILCITSATKRCGKTTLMHLLSALTPRPLLTSNITPAALFRIVEACSPTLLIDEADSFFASRDELRGIVNSGHRRGSAYVIRTAGDDHEPRTFATWSPKAIAQIGRPPETIIDRSMVIGMRRRAPDEAVERLRLDRLRELQPLCRRAWRWAQDNLEALRNADPDVPPGLGDREADNWRPLLAVADAAGGHWPEAARAAAVGLASIEQDDAPSVQLLADIRLVLRDRKTDRITSSDLALALHAPPESQWAEWNAGKPLSTIQLAKLLKAFGIKPRALWIRTPTGTKNLRGYEASAFHDAFRRYLPPDDPQDPQES
ncbi:MAG: DUF3631 domain-containing protein [Gemmatimonadota bacterium]